MDFQTTKEFILSRLGKELSPKLHYHCYEHTIQVAESIAIIAEAEQVQGSDLMLLLTAALFHDCGFMEVYQEHEKQGCEIARKHLPDFGYSNQEIEQICGMIMATKFPQQPQNELEEIICDADLSYLGGENIAVTARNLFLELLEYNLIDTEENWNRMQLAFLKSHSYFTPYARKSLEPRKEGYLQEIKDIVSSY